MSRKLAQKHPLTTQRKATIKLLVPASRGPHEALAIMLPSSVRPLPAGHPFLVADDGSLTLPDAPARLKRRDFDCDDAYEQAVTRRKQESAERRKWQEWLRDQQRDRGGRARPSEDAKKLTPDAKRVKIEVNAKARRERAQEKYEVHEERRREQLEAKHEVVRSQIAGKKATEDTARAAERAAFDAQCAARVAEREQREAAQAAQAAQREESVPHAAKPAPRWWTQMGRTQDDWELSLEQLKREREEHVAAKANAAAHGEVDCVRCGRLFERRRLSDVRCDVCARSPLPRSDQNAAPEATSDHESDADAPLYADVDPIDRSEGAYFSGGLVFRDETEREASLTLD